MVASQPLARDTIEIEGLTLECILGVLPHEREQEQPIRLDLELGLDLGLAGRTTKIADTIDYDRVTTEVGALLAFRRYRLLENAAEELAAMLFGVHPGLESVRLRLAKPRALAGRATAAAVHIARAREDFVMGHEPSRFGDVDILLETHEAGLYLLHVAAGHEIPPHHHRVMRELEWLVRGELHHRKQRVPLAQPIAWARGQAHGYRNDSDQPATLFCCDCPPFIPDDEIDLDAVGQ